MWIDDFVLKNCHKSLFINTFIPQELKVVLGQSNQETKEVNLLSCEEDSVSILRRKGGGGTVVLHKGCLVVSMGMWVRDFYENKKYFEKLNNSIIASLARESKIFSSLDQNGISDIVYQDKKVAGTSMFRSRNYLLFQASILVEPKVTLFEKYLKHPTKEPEYRNARNHSDFVTGLGEIDPSTSPQLAKRYINQNIKIDVEKNLSHNLILPVKEQIPHIRKRIQT